MLMQKVRNLRELANLAGVSASTASRALANSPLLSDATRDRIKRLANEHAFHPNATARNLRNRRTSRVAVAIPRDMEDDPFFSTMLGMLGDGLAARDLDVLLVRFGRNQSAWLEAFAASGRVDGMILLGQSDNFDAIERLASRYHALVVWGANLAGQIHCSVGTDNYLGGALAARHLLDVGCRRIAFLGDPTAIEIFQRLAGAQETIAKCGLGEPMHVIPFPLGAPSAHHDIVSYLNNSASRPDGIFAASDLLAMNALKALSDCSTAVPDAVKVVGFDGLGLTEITVPTLTTVCQDLSAGAELLIDQLEQRIAGKPTPCIILPPRLRVRSSTWCRTEKHDTTRCISAPPEEQSIEQEPKRSSK
ncbi:DNA-binding LacI/PurR family transcriptional regulator [Novosphingobium sp. SG751A]|nr:DNA-binding LacI/PurR family transcriptional regulator [Novosphingobium sp. SG751A]